MSTSTETTAAARTALAAAAAAARLLPSTVPLEAVPAVPGSGPQPADVAVVAAFVGSPSADLVLVAEQAVAAALAGAGQDTPVALADALRPALEAAAAELGAGVLDVAHTAPAGSVVPADGYLFALQRDGEPIAWFAVRLRAEPVAAAEGRSASARRPGLAALYDVEMTLTAELGRTRLPVRQVLDLVPGSVLELDRPAGSPADVLVNGRLIARGEVVVVDEDYGVRITEIVTGPDGAA